ncbi:MAG: type II secretion system F family protein [Actinomycetota bacterium]
MTPAHVPLVFLGAVALAVVAAVGRRRRRRHRRQLAIDGSLALTIDVVSVVVGSGGTVRQAVTAVATGGPEPVRPAFANLLDHVRGGHRLGDALGEASVTLGPTFHPLIGALLAAEVDGAPLASVLSRLGDDIEQRDRWRAETSAGRVPVALLPPLVVCLLPAVVVGAVVPLAVVALRQLG